MWQAVLSSRTAGGNGCPYCAGKEVSITNSLASLFPDIAAEWHPTKNGDLSPDKVVAGSGKSIWWKCPKEQDHEWEATLAHRTHGEGATGCPFCKGQKASISNSLASLFPEIAAEWHPTKNGDLTPDNVTAGSGKKVWWQCLNGSDHEWQAVVGSRTNLAAACPRCNKGWTVPGIRAFVSSLKEHLQTFTPAELYLLFQQNGLLTSAGKGKTFVKALSTGRFPKEEIEKFINGNPSLVDEFVQDTFSNSRSPERCRRKLSHGRDSSRPCG